MGTSGLSTRISLSPPHHTSLPHSLNAEPSSPSFPSPTTSKVEKLYLIHGAFCRYRSVVDMVKSWHQEKQHYSFPHPHECNPRCPSKCSGSVCSHYTQVSPTGPRDLAANRGQLTAPWAAAASCAASSPSPHSSWDVGWNPGSCLLQIRQQGRPFVLLMSMNPLSWSSFIAPSRM